MDGRLIIQMTMDLYPIIEAAVNDKYLNAWELFRQEAMCMFSFIFQVTTFSLGLLLTNLHQ